MKQDIIEQSIVNRMIQLKRVDSEGIKIVQDCITKADPL